MLSQEQLTMIGKVADNCKLVAEEINGATDRLIKIAELMTATLNTLKATLDQETARRQAAPTGPVN